MPEAALYSKSLHFQHERSGKVPRRLNNVEVKSLFGSQSASKKITEILWGICSLFYMILKPILFYHPHPPLADPSQGTLEVLRQPCSNGL